MTRLMTIVNTSNWDGENWVLTVEYDRRNSDGEQVTESNKIVLEPGERFYFNPGFRRLVSIEPAESKTPEPFLLNGRQVVPSVVATVGRGIDRPDWRT